jgi:predicted DNA-binding transcriptional regulator YafY
MTALDSITRELQAAAQRLREQDLDPDEAADLVERCAALAARAGSELEQKARASAQDEP